MSLIRPAGLAPNRITSSPQNEQRAVDPVADRARFRQAVQALLDGHWEFDGFLDDGKMDMNELYASARGEKGKELEVAAKFILTRPQYLAELDMAAYGGKPDGAVSMEDMKAQIGKLDRGEPLPAAQSGQRLFVDPAADRAQFRTAVAAVLKNFPEYDGWFDDGKMDMNELYASARGERGAEVVEAAKFILARPEYLAELDMAADGGKPDGTVSRNDLNAQLGRLDREGQLQTLRYDPRLGEFQRTVSALVTHWPELDVAGGGIFGADGRVSRQDLDAVVADMSYPAELREAASYLIANPDLAGVLDTAAKGGSGDGVISTEDLQTLNVQLAGLRSALPMPLRPINLPVR